VQTLAEIKALLAARGVQPKHRFGQNFLHDHNQLRKLVDAACVRPGELVLEVGPGTGTLTETLVELGAEVVACEIDRDMQAILRERLGDRLGDRVRLVADDCLDGKHALSPALLEALGGRPFVLVANLPYGAASPLMAILASRHPECRGQFVTIQREVADRIRAEVGCADYGALTVLLQLTSTIREIAVLKPASFWPMPDVTSSMIAIEPRPDPVFGGRGESTAAVVAFERFVHELFSKRRKQLGGILRAAGMSPAIWPEGVAPDARPETLSPTTILALHRAVLASAPREPPRR
jgi:16S rRNA (adenine1518-N6/adenine1519-N6)-dimethyltransferase